MAFGSRVCVVLWHLRTAPLTGGFADGGIAVGLEYALLNNQKLVSGMSESFAETGLTSMKHFAEAVEWGAMQKGPDRPTSQSWTGSCARTSTTVSPN